ncbi:hypothetical protein BDQ12DRAFT_73566 [Crucibulum laeve]|uniref:F-box domain-containing protein n=1 Tax=Crucibulum laeve TaxID=68775 RepID=A0A5C3M1B5_9AGAR|nr:hypothetical protein BDQ12DRAFT_73566 [Crucibulum laeve]
MTFLASTSVAQACELRLVSREVNKSVISSVFRDLLFTTPEQVIRFSNTLHPKSKVIVPALKRRLHTLPLNILQCAVESLTLVVPNTLPSIETSLSHVAPLLTRIRKLAITGQQLASNAYWLRMHEIRPQHMMILHHGVPPLVNFYEPIFQSVTHLYTSSLFGHHNGSSILSMPSITHLAVSTRTNIALQCRERVIAFLHTILTEEPTSKTLQMVVLSLNCGVSPSYRADPWLYALRSCMVDKRFILLPYSQSARTEWEDTLTENHDIWSRANTWRELESSPDTAANHMKKEMIVRDLQCKERRSTAGEWMVDLVQREDYHQEPIDPGERNEFRM